MPPLSDDNGIESKLIDVHTHDLEEYDSDDTHAYTVAEWVMREFNPGFVIVASPNMRMTAKGVVYPDSIGIVIDTRLQITKTVLAEILLEIAAQLGGDMMKIEQFIKEALPSDE